MQHTFLESFAAVLAYSRRDTALARQLQRDLQAEGVATWTGDYLKPESDYWLSSMQQAIDRAGLLILILTPRALSARGVRDAVRHALLHDIEIIPLLLGGDFESSQPPNIQHLSAIDLRGLYQRGESLAHADVLAAFRQHDEKTRAFNPIDPRAQARLLYWVLRAPTSISDYQKRVGLRSLNRTAAWLAAGLVGAFFLVALLLNLLTDYRPPLLVGGLFLVALYIIIGRSQHLSIPIVSYRWSAIVAVLGSVVAVPLLLSLQPGDLRGLPPPGADDWLLPLLLVLLGSIALAITETFEVRTLLLPFLSFVSAAAMALAMAQSLAASLARSISNEAGTLGALTLIGSTISALTITALYSLSFFVANDFIDAIYTRGTVSRVGRSVTALLPMTYAALIVAEVV